MIADLAGESPARVLRESERRELEDLNGRLQLYIMKQRAKDAALEGREVDQAAVLERAEALVKERTVKYEELLKQTRAQRDDHSAAREELQVRVARQESTIETLTKQVAAERKIEADLEMRIEKLSAELENNQAQISELEEENFRFKSNFEKAEMARATIAEQFAGAQQAADKASHEATQLRARVTSLTQDLEVLQQTSEQELTRLRVELDEVTVKEASVEDSIREEFAQQLAEIVEEYREKCNKEKETITQQIKAHYVPKLNEARLAIEELSLKEQEALEQITLLNEEIDTYKLQIETLIAERSHFEKRAMDLEKALEEERNAVPDEAMVHKEEEVRRLRKMLQAKEEEFDTLMDVKIQLTLEIEKYHSLLEEEESRLGYHTPASRKRKRTRTDSTGSNAGSKKRTAGSMSLTLNEKEAYLELGNLSKQVCSMDGWVIQSRATGHQFPFDDKVQIKPKQCIKVWLDIEAQDETPSESDDRDDGVTNFVWKVSEPDVLANDELLLLDSDGNVTASTQTPSRHSSKNCILM